MSTYKFEIGRGVNCLFDFKDGHLVLLYDDREIALNNGEVHLLIEALTLMLINENSSDIESWLKASLATSFTLAFNETRKICKTKENNNYSVTLGLLVESSQTAYNLHKSRDKSNS